MARLRDLLGYKTYAIRSDGAKFVNGVRDDGADTSWLTYQSGVLTLGPGLYDELLILDRAATEDEILAWYKARSPFYDSSSIIQGTHIADGAITTEKIVAGAITADKLAANSVSADKIFGGTLRLTGDMAIVNEDETVQITSRGIEIDTGDQGSTQWSPGGLVFSRPDGTKSGYLRAIVPGIAQDGDFVPLNFVNEPVVILSPARAIMYDPSVGSLQKLRLEAVDVSPEGFRVVAKLVRHDGAGQRIVFPETEKYYWRSGQWCINGGHTASEEVARAWSEHRLRDVGDKKVFVTSSGTTGVIIRVREMFHAHAWAGDRSATNSISYRLRIRPVGSGSWTQTVGPITRSINVRSSVLRDRMDYRHSRVTHVIEGLTPDEYELEIEVTGKSLSSQGSNSANAMYLLIEEIEEMQEEEIPTPEPIVVHYVAFESDSAGDDEE